MIEAYVQYGIYVARVVLTSCLLYGLFTVNETRFVLDFIDVTFVWHLCAKKNYLFCFILQRNLQFLRVYVITMIFACIYYFLMSNVMLFTNFDVAIQYFITFCK